MDPKLGDDRSEDTDARCRGVGLSLPVLKCTWCSDPAPGPPKCCSKADPGMSRRGTFLAGSTMLFGSIPIVNFRSSSSLLLGSCTLQSASTPHLILRARHIPILPDLVLPGLTVNRPCHSSLRPRTSVYVLALESLADLVDPQRLESLSRPCFVDRPAASGPSRRSETAPAGHFVTGSTETHAAVASARTCAQRCRSRVSRPTHSARTCRSWPFLFHRRVKL